jgi:steroid 5-alpha reductase family enzyme
MPALYGSLILLGLGIALALMWALWLIQLRTKNAGLADFGRVLGIVLLAGLYAWVGTGWNERKIIVCLMASLWGIRLGFYLLFTRVIGKPEDGRYRQLRREWKKNLDQKFLYLFEFQALPILIFSLPFLFSCFNGLDELVPLEKASAELWLFAFLGEALADYQLSRFNRNKYNRKKTCRVGLWKYSRHPNYFFGWLICCANALFALSAPNGGWALLCPGIILIFVFKGIGIPANEAQALRTRGADYRNYQHTTSVFVPWPKKV